MKKIALIMVLAALFTFSVSAASVTYDLTYIKSDKINIDGVLSQGEYDGASSVTLTKENTGMWANFYDENSRLPLTAYFFYGDEGIYVGADIYDNDPDTENMHDCFEVAFNPGGLIPDGDRLEGLFFTFWLDGDDIIMKRHNQLDETQGGTVQEDAVCKYKMNDHGYSVEALIKWEYLTLADRPVLNTESGEYETGVLDKFNPRADGAYIYAIVCYLNGNGDDDAPYRCVYRTVTEAELAGNFSTATYDIRLNIKPVPAETTQAVTNAVTTSAQITTEAVTDTEAIPVGDDTSNTVWIITLTCIAAVVAAGIVFIAVKQRRTK